MRRLALAAAVVVLAALSGFGGYLIGTDREADRTEAAEARTTLVAAEPTRCAAHRPSLLRGKAAKALYDNYVIPRGHWRGFFTEADRDAADAAAEQVTEANWECFGRGNG